MDGVTYPLPTFLREKLRAEYSPAEVEKIVCGYEKKRPVTLRVNTVKSSAGEVLEALSAAGISAKGVSWSDSAMILDGATESDVRPLEIYVSGKIYLQSLSSQLPPIAMDLSAGQDVLDMTAAPGGKTSEIYAMTGGKVNLTACERDTARAEQLRFNLKKQGVSANVLQTDARTISDFFRFDNVLLDAPCSGSGILNVRNPKIATTFTLKLIEKTTRLQEALLKKALTVLKAGQTMVYSTCSVLKEENENVVSKVLRDFNACVVPIKFSGNKDLPTLESTIPGAVTVCPTELYEGFFMAKIRKNR